MSRIPVDLRKVDKEQREEMKEFWSRLSSRDRRMVNLIGYYLVQEEANDHYKNYK